MCLIVCPFDQWSTIMKIYMSACIRIFVLCVYAWSMVNNDLHIRVRMFQMFIQNNDKHLYNDV